MGRLRLRSTRVGDALLIHPKGRFDERAAAFAEGITGDPGHTLVVVDLPAGALATEWEAVAKLLSSSRYGSPRLVFGRGTGDDVRTAGRLIATRLGREVLAPDGDLIPTRSGQLFVPGDDGAAWLRFRPGRDAEPVGQRFPKPHWEFSAPARTRPAGTHSVAQPVPAGVWLRRTDGDPPAGRYRRAMETLPIDADLYLVALGSPGTPPLALADVARFWDTVLPGARSAVRFLLYGALDTPADRAPGQALADALGHRTVLYGGPVPGETGAAAEAAEAVYVPSEVALPVPDSASVPVPVPLPLPRIRTESGGGSAAGTTAAAGAGTAKGSDTEPTSVPEPSPEAVQAAVSAAAPLPFPPNSPAPSPEPAPEITEPQQPDPVPPAPESAPAPAPAPAQRPVRPATPRFRLESAVPVTETGDIDVPVPAPAPDVAEVPSARPDAVPDVRVQPVPRASACALPPERGIAQERDWVRRTLHERYHAQAGFVSRVMSESPGLRGRSRTEAADALTELVAVRLYLSGDSRRADAAVREATAGPHVPLARCVTAGLRRLPSYRGPALLRTRLGEAERAWYREGRAVTEWAFCHARTSLHPGPRGSAAADATDILIWSMTARRTTSLDPAVRDRVLFLPGTVFKVLRAEGSTVLMRELSPSESTGDGRADPQRAKLDEIAVKGLEKILDALEKAGTDAAAESADPPGLIVTPQAVRTEGAKP